MSESRVVESCEACGRFTDALRTVGTKDTGDERARVCIDATACQRRIVGAKRQGNRPIESTYAFVAELLRDMSEHVALGDSFEGSIEYSMPDVPDWAQLGEPAPDGWVPAEVLVRCAYRVGNREGQGGYRIVGSVNR